MIPEFQGFPTFSAPDGVVRAWYFEPLVAVVSFFAWIHLWGYAERQRGLSNSKSLKEYLANPAQGYSFWTVVLYVVGIYIWKMFVPPVAPNIPDGIPSSLPELAYLIAEVSAGIVWYDFIFFFIHWSMHEIPFLRELHHDHHAVMPGGILEANHVLHHSFADGTFQVLVNIFVQRRTPWGAVKTRLARILHNIVITSMLTESHSASPTPYFWRRWFVGVREHRLHHFNDHCSRSLWILTNSENIASKGKFDRHQQFFGYLDNLRFMLSCGEYQLSTSQRRLSQKTC
ncbi:hypothetical protein ACA910_007863 [Epithemia clementina (nom. ined.)]